ncbi:type II toxin-antitoxin system ParD family antitoxin, partial [Salinibacterium sp.]|uniref:type II toxin-antitoxin system ParD family antitoxin n=1 Tax=Salinibacterium sp. TaxID=1915057 RepID=UPI0037C9B800
MAVCKISISLPDEDLAFLDIQAAAGRYHSGSAVILTAMRLSDRANRCGHFRPNEGQSRSGSLVSGAHHTLERNSPSFGCSLLARSLMR